MNDRKFNYDWADVAKGIGIILVVLGHSIEYCDGLWGGWEIVYKALASFHMPLFFFISAFLQRKKELRKPQCYENNQLYIRVCSLIIPYCVFSVVFWLSKVLMSTLVHNTVGLKDLLLIIIYPLSTLWFLYALVLFILLRASIYKAKISSIIVLIACIGLRVMCGDLPLPSIMEPTVLHRVLLNSPFYAAGIVAAEVDGIEKIIKKKIPSLIMAPLSFIALYCLKGHVGILNSVVTLLLGFTGIWLTLCIADSIGYSFLNKLGTASLGIYLMHDYIVCFTVIFLRKSIGILDLMISLATILGVMVPYVIYQICINNKYLVLMFKPQKVLAKKWS